VSVTVNYCALEYKTPFLLLAFLQTTGNAISVSATPVISTCPVADETFVVYGNYYNMAQTFVTNLTTNGVPPLAQGSTVNGVALPVQSSFTGCEPQTANYSITVPASLPAGQTFVLAGTLSDDVNACNTTTTATVTTAPFTLAPPASALSINKTADALTSTAGVAAGQVLYTINYSIANDSNLVITDQVPTGCTLLQISPGGTASGSTLTWNPVTGTVGAQTSGYVWFLCTLNSTDATGLQIANTAQATSTNHTATSNQALCTVDGGFTLSKSQSVSAAAPGQDITYVLAATYSGQSLLFYDSYDNDSSSHTSASTITGYDGTAYTNVPEGGSPGAWSAATDSQGNHYLISNGLGYYPAELRSSPSPACYNYTVQGDLMVDPSQTSAQGQDAMMVIQSDGTWQNGYAVGISSDPYPSKVFLQENLGGAPTNVKTDFSETWITAGVWYTVQAQLSYSGSTLSIAVKVWPKGTTEPAAPNFIYTTTTPAPCTNGGNYVGWQSENGVDEYGNLQVVGPDPAVNTRVYDTLPTGLSFVSASGTGTYDAGAFPNMVSWSLPGNTMPPFNASFTWVGEVLSCTSPLIVNQAAVAADNNGGAVSNVVSAMVATCSPTDTPTNTATVTLTDTPTLTSTETDTATSTQTDTATPTATPSVTQTDTPTATATSTATPSDTPTSTATPTYTNTPFDTPTPTFTNTPTATATPTSTSTPTATPSSTETATASNTPSNTPTLTCTATPSDTATFTDTPSATPSSTRTVTPSPTPTSTPTFTQTATPSRTPTSTATSTVTPSPSITPTYILANEKVDIGIYNSAGELVLTLYQGSGQLAVGSPHLSQSAIGSGQATTYEFDGFLMGPSGELLRSLTWNGLNQNGQSVSTGVYTIQTTLTNAFGQVTAMQTSVQVLAIPLIDSLILYNSAGEAVAHLTLPNDSGHPIGSLWLPSRSFAITYNPATGKPNGVFNLALTGDHPPCAQCEAQWDGTNDQGAPVSPGIYTAELTVTQPEGGKNVIIQSFTVIDGASPLGFGGAKAVPNPAMKGSPLVVFYPVLNGYTVDATLYDLAGGKVEDASDAGNVGALNFQTSSLASGVYIVRMRRLTENGETPVALGSVKMAVIR